MKKLELSALFLIILLILINFLSFFGNSLIARLYGPQFIANTNFQLKLITSVRSILTTIVNLVVGIWLFIQARQSKGTPWIWLLFGMVYGLIAAVLFFLLKIHELRRGENSRVSV